MEAFVYCWTDLETNKLYVGVHKGTPDDGYVCSSKIMMEEYKSRPNDFVRQIVACGTHENMVNFESTLLNGFNVRYNADFYNISTGAGDFYFPGHTEESIQKIKKKVGPKTRERNKKQVGELNPFYGRTHTDEVKKILSEKNSGKNNPHYGKKRPEHGPKVSRALKGRKKTPEHCKALSEAHKGKVCKQYSWRVQKGDEIITVVNLRKFCRDNNLMFSRLYRGVDTDGYLLLGRVL